MYILLLNIIDADPSYVPQERLVGSEFIRWCINHHNSLTRMKDQGDFGI